ncbi:MAG: hypothetical protein JKY53_07035 [Flavobacteriales bacterium]|nr:hypothetical protein [Flavobacteriales bacterium]
MKKQHIIILFFATILIIACNSKQQKEEIKTTKEGANTDSEMTLLMREMHNNFAVVRDSIMAQKNIDRARFNEIHGVHMAIPTDSTIMGAVFEGMATSFLEAVDSLILGEQNKEMYFNITVQSCIGCHQEFAPDSKDKIKELFIEPKQEQQ